MKTLVWLPAVFVVDRFATSLFAPLGATKTAAAPLEVKMPYQIVAVTGEAKSVNFAVVDARSGVNAGRFNTLTEAETHLASLLSSPAQIHQGATAMSVTDTTPTAPDVTPTADPVNPDVSTAQDAEQDARLDGLEQRVADLEALCSELMTQGLTVDEIMPADQMMV